MTSKDAFLEQIRKTPKDDTVRLAFADFAEETLGFKFWPRLIRAQIQRQGDWKYEAWNCSGSAAHEMGLNDLGTIGQYGYDARRKDTRVSVYVKKFGKEPRYDVVLDRGFPRQLIYKSDLRPFAEQAGALFRWPIVSVLTTAAPFEDDPSFLSPFHGVQMSYDWWSARAMGARLGYVLPDALLRRIARSYIDKPGVAYVGDNSAELSDYVEFADRDTAEYALKRAIMAYGREAYKATLKKSKKKGG
jgi:uncharacterized protein (TIGR02996 family)